ncbi:BatD family protein [Thermococcus atlanticus]
MKRHVALIVIGVLILSAMPLVKSTSVPSQASLDLITLHVGDSIVLGDYKITFSSLGRINPGNVLAADIEVSGPEGKDGYPLSNGDWALYPSATNPLLNISVVWLKENEQTALIRVSSPLEKLIPDETLSVGDYLTLPSGFPRIKIKLAAAYSTRAVFNIYLPYTSTPKTVTVDEDDGVGVAYKLAEDMYYSPYIFIYLKDSKSGSSAKFDLYVPKVFSTKFQIEKPGGGTTTPATPSVIELVYNDLLYTGESLPVDVNGTEYRIKLLSTIPNIAKVAVIKGNETLDTLVLETGDVPKKVKNAPIELAVQKVEVQYNRATIKVYAPQGSTAIPILRSANIKVGIDTSQKVVMLGNNLVVVITVQNSGKGDAYNLNVAAPIPNNFEVVSAVKTWELKTLPAFADMPALIYVLKPTKVGEYKIGRAVVTFYDPKSIDTGKKKTAVSNELSGIKVYAIPEVSVSAAAYNGTWSDYIRTGPGKQIKIRFSVRASAGNPTFEFVKNATLSIELPGNLEGPATIPLGMIKAGGNKTVEASFKVTTEDFGLVRARLTYLDPLGGHHELNLGNLITVNSLPPKIEVKEKVVKVYPDTKELPQFINQTLSKMTDATSLAKEIAGIVNAYIPPKKSTNYWKPLGILFLLLSIVLGAAAYRYWAGYERAMAELRRKKKSRPGGLPKKEVREEESTEEKAEELI